MPEHRARASRWTWADRTAAGLRYGLAAAAGLWVLTVGLAEIAAAPSVAIGRRLLEDASFTQDELVAAMDSAAKVETSSAAWARAVIALRLFEMESAAPEPVSAVVEERRQSAEDAVRAALRLSPSNGYLWFALFALNTTQGDVPSRAALAYLAKSYELAPWEGWVAIRRSPTLMPIRASLPTEIKRHVEAEFRTLLKQNILPPVQKVFATSDPALRMEVLSHIETLPAVERLRFIRGLSRELDGRAGG